MERLLSFNFWHHLHLCFTLSHVGGRAVILFPSYFNILVLKSALDFVECSKKMDQTFLFLSWILATPILHALGFEICNPEPVLCSVWTLPLAFRAKAAVQAPLVPPHAPYLAPAHVILDAVNGEGNHLHIALAEFGGQLCRPAKLCGADGCEVPRVGEEDAPSESREQEIALGRDLFWFVPQTKSCIDCTVQRLLLEQLTSVLS